MRVSQQEKDRSHARIIASAAALMRQQGVEGASVADIMQASGMSHGGFYKHFASKEAMLLAALDHAFDEIAERLRPELAVPEATAAAADFNAYYLSDGHLAAPGKGCPIATVSADIARGASVLKSRFGAGVKRVVTLLARGTSGSEKARRARATRQLAMMAGAVMIARASDPDTAREVIAACRERPG